MALPKKKIAWAFIFCLSSFMAAAQPSLKTDIDNTSIIIGEQIKLRISATIPRQDFFVKWAEIPDTLPHIEIVEKSKIDSSFTNQKLTGLSQTITVTSFDSGKWLLPSFNIDFNPVDGSQPYNLYTDSFSVNVTYQPDSTSVLRDIKAIREAKPFSLYQLLLLITLAGLVFLLLLAWVLYAVIKKRQNKKAVSAKPASAYQYAMLQMEKLKQINTREATGAKAFYSGLSEVIKQYLSSRHGQHFISSTTREVLLALNQKKLPGEMLAKISVALNRGDAAKFAKFLPTEEEGKESWVSIKETIDFIEALYNKEEQSAG